MGGLTAAELAQAAGRLAWSAMVRLPAKTVVLQCHCWGGWSLVAAMFAGLSICVAESLVAQTSGSVPKAFLVWTVGILYGGGSRPG
jgi:DMSO/TMAO reductase YedYZ molybdopterin-dependent catalytic subunit